MEPCLEPMEPTRSEVDHEVSNEKMGGQLSELSRTDTGSSNEPNVQTSGRRAMEGPRRRRRCCPIAIAARCKDAVIRTQQDGKGGPRAAL
jgi:hypothetical protein